MFPELLKEFHLSNVVTFPGRVRKKGPAQIRGFSLPAAPGARTRGSQY
jgi:hypothetical protein